MSKLKELTWENHQKAERMVHARKLLKGMDPHEYHTFIYNQYVQYAALESVAKERGILEGIEDICRAPGFRKDMLELEEQYGIETAFQPFGSKFPVEANIQGGESDDD